MARLLIVHHTPSPGMQAMLEAVREGAREVGGLEVELRPALTAGAADALGADAIILGTPANIGYMSGAMKHFFDTIYYPVLEAMPGRPYALYVHGNSDTGGTVRGVESIAKGLGWRPLRPALTVVGEVAAVDLDDCRDLGGLAALAALGET